MFNRRVLTIMAAFLVGQCVQLLAHVLCMQLLYNWQIPTCIAAGFLITVAVFGGVYIASGEQEGKHK